MIFDCFLYIDERELLELHLATVGPFVDRFVICESNTTFRGEPRESAFPALADLPYAEKVHCVSCDMQGMDLGAWDREAMQRNAAGPFLGEHARDDDWILVGDVDEIPSPEFLRNPREGVLEMRITQGWMNWFATYRVRSTVSIQRKHMQYASYTRDLRTVLDAIPDSGWHLTYTGGVEAIQQKLRSFSHTEYSVPPYTDREYIEARMNAGVGFFNAPEPRTFFPAPIEELPPYVAEHRERFEHLLRECR